MASQHNTITEVSTLTRVPSKVISALAEKTNLCIGSAINDAILNKEQFIQVNIGIGILSISIEDMQCKFIPSKELKAIIKKCISEPVNPLELVLENALIDKLISICGEEI